ncbi:MAG: Fur family transcriptional regulator [Microcella pacifica]
MSHTASDHDTSELLRDVGLRVTAGRLAVLDALERMPHSNAETVRQALTDSPARLSLQAVHNVLGDLAEAGVLRRIQPARSAARYKLRVGDNHHHAVCSSCGAVTDVDCVVGHAPCLTPSGDTGFAIAAAEVTFWGLCADCTAASPSSSPASAAASPDTPDTPDTPDPAAPAGAAASTPTEGAAP